MRVVGQVAARIGRLLERRGLGPAADPSDADPLSEEEPLLAQLYGASVNGLGQRLQDAEADKLHTHPMW